MTVVVRGVPRELFQQARELARAEGKGVTELVTELFRAYIETRVVDEETASAPIDALRKRRRELEALELRLAADAVDPVAGATEK